MCKFCKVLCHEHLEVSWEPYHIRHPGFAGLGGGAGQGRTEPDGENLGWWWKKTTRTETGRKPDGLI